MPEPLPNFVFHPDPLATGSIGIHEHDANNEAILRWAELAMTDSWFVDPAGASIEIWNKDAHDRAMVRKQLGRKIEEFLKEHNAGSAHSRGEVETSLLVRPRHGTTCGRSDLAKVRDTVKNEIAVDLKAAGFLTMTRDLDGAVLKL